MSGGAASYPAFGRRTRETQQFFTSSDFNGVPDAH